MTDNTSEATYHILVAISGPDDFRYLLYTGCFLAKTHQGRLTLITIRPKSVEKPEWLQIPAELTDIPMTVKVVQSESVADVLLKQVQQFSPDLLVLGWRGMRARQGYLLGSTLDHILHHPPCNLAVARANTNWPEDGFLEKETIKILVPTAGGPNTPLAMNLALGFSKQTDVTALYVMREADDDAKLEDRQKWLAEFTQPWTPHPHFQVKVIQSNTLLKAVVEEAKNYDLTLLGASNESIFSRLMFGEIPQKIALENPGTTIVVKQFEGSFDTTLRRAWWHTANLFPQLSSEDRVEVYKQIRRGARPQIDFFMMITLAAGIAAFGLLVDSPAIIIGAMLVAPLMAAIIGVGLAVIQADIKLLALAGSATFRGMFLAVLTGLVVGLMLPVDEPTAEILSRISPSLFDLGVALISGFAGAYALCRPNVSSSLPGVAIAVALVPPLATVGIGISWLNPEIAWGAFILFSTNLVSIIAAGGLVFFLLGFRPKLTRRGRLNIFGGGLVGSTALLVLMGWVLWILSVDSFRQTYQERVIEEVLSREVSEMTTTATLESWEILKGEAEAEDNPQALKLEVQFRSAENPPHNAIVTLQNEVASALREQEVLEPEQPLALILLMLPTTILDPLVPPTPTVTVTPGPTRHPP